MVGKKQPLPHNQKNKWSVPNLKKNLESIPPYLHVHVQLK